MKILRYTYLISFLFSFESIIIGQNVYINGHAKGAEGKTIFLTTYSDQITFTEKKLASAKVDASGQFRINAEINQTIRAFIKVDNHKSDIYINPGRQYDIDIQMPSKSVKEFRFIISNQKENDLNVIIPKFNTLYDDFALNEFYRILKNRVIAVFDSFKLKTDSTFKDVKNKYFEDYIYYKFGYWEFMGSLENKAYIEKTYFYNKPVLNENPAYMEFFNEFYLRYYTDTRYAGPSQISAAVNDNKDFEALQKIISKDTLIKDGLAEMVLLRELNDLYHAKGYNKDNILYMIKDAEIKMKNVYNKQIAENLYKLLTKLKTGTKAPDFKLTDTKGNKISLNNFKGKYIYLSFWKSNIKECLAEIQAMSTLYEKYKDSVEFISICADPEGSTQCSVLSTQNKWTFAYFNDDWDLLNAYDIRIYPTFVFIDDEGNIDTYPATKPSEKVQLLFDKIKRNKK